MYLMKTSNVVRKGHIKCLVVILLRLELMFTLARLLPMH